MKLLYSAAAAATIATSVAAIDPGCPVSFASLDTSGVDVGAADVVSLNVDGLLAANMNNVEYAFVATNGETPGIEVKLFGFQDPSKITATAETEGNGVGISIVGEQTDGNVETTSRDCSTPTVVVSVTFPQDHCWKRGSDAGGNNRLLKQDSTKCVRVLHINDFHSYVDGLVGGPCEPKANRPQSTCDGGWAKIFTLVKQLAAGAPGRTLLIDAGDQFTGTVWSSVYEGKESSQFLNALCEQTDQKVFECVGAIGNHEFDYGLKRLAEYTNDLKFDVVNANILDTCDDSGLTVVPRKVVEINGIKIGLTGVTTTETKETSSAPDCINFADERETISEQTEILRKESGVDGVIAISHTGFSADISIAKNAANKPDLIIGGHSHTALWSSETLGSFPGSKANPFLRSSGEYPTSVGSGEDLVKVVQAGSFGGFVGGIDLIFNEDGTIDTNAVQQFPYGKDSTISNNFRVAEDPVAVALIEELRGAVDALRTDVVGKTEVFLNRNDISRRETNLGNLICDSVLESLKDKTLTGTDGKSRKVGMCVLNSGGIRENVEIGDVTTGGIISVAPFGDSVSIVQMTGKRLILSMEHGFNRFGQNKGEFPQIGGFILEYNPDESVKSACRTYSCLNDDVEPAKVTGLFYDDESRTPVGMDDVIYVATNDFVAKGGAGYATFGASETLTPSAVPLQDAIRNYVKDITPITAEKYGDDVQTRIIPTTVVSGQTGSSAFIVGGIFSVFGLGATMVVLKKRRRSTPATEDVSSSNPVFGADTKELSSSNPEFMA